MLSAMEGVEPQLLAHVRIGMNTGLTENQLQQLAGVLAEQVGPEAAARLRAALDQDLTP